MYLAALLLVYAVLLVGLSGAPGGLGGNGGLIVAQGLIGLGIAIVGWTVTLGQAPRGVWVRENSLVVRERLGREREFPAPAEGGVVVVRRYAAGWLSNEPAAIVRLKDASGLPRVYLVGDTLIPAAAPG